MDFEKWQLWRASDKSTKAAKKLLSDLVLSNTGLVNKVAREYARVADKEDLVQAGYMGVIRALELFDPGGRPEKVRTIETLWYVFARYRIRYAVQEAARQAQCVRRARGDAYEFAAPAELEDTHMGLDAGALLEAPDLSRALAATSPAERDAVLGVVCMGYSLPELAAAHGWTEDAAGEYLAAGWATVCALVKGAGDAFAAPIATDTDDGDGCEGAPAADE